MVDTNSDKDNELTAILNEESNVEGLSMIVFSGDLDKILAAFIIANGAAAMDLPVTMFFTFWGINVLRREGPVEIKEKKSFMEKMFGWMMPKGPQKLKLSKMNMGGLGTTLMKKEMAKKNVFDLPKLIHEAQDGGVNMIVCTMSMDVMGIRKEELLSGVDFGGVATYIDRADSSSITLFV
ncbi:MAG: DsrE/DsrF/DrsH-like family protein [Chloroflexota bacterium]|nr:DsrE/DsrF/DrsH-like family protein [Chloroflexota bacterium]